ncbi:MAG: hypothetical protein Q7K44_01445 [Candidatus Liptonbacteria bacterium]|nr:hypothetical protein [Candidatus Liptonbacteria bacterium]
MEEIELTYLVKELPTGVKNSPHKEILDIYIPNAAGHATLRIRKAGRKYEITKKEPIHKADSSHQLESSISLTAEEFGELSQLEGMRIRKKRYYYQENGTNYEIDIFQDGLSGLVLADVEFDSLEEKAAFTSPAWCLAEVTQEKFLAGGMLCGKVKYADIETQLGKFGYNKINE